MTDMRWLLTILILIGLVLALVLIWRVTAPPDHEYMFDEAIAAKQKARERKKKDE